MKAYSQLESMIFESKYVSLLAADLHSVLTHVNSFYNEVFFKVTKL
jgi:hypothetical protein